MPVQTNNINVFALFLPEIKEFLKEKKFQELKELLKKIHSMDLSEGFKNLTSQEQVLVFKLLSTKKAIEVFENLKIDEQSFLLNNLGNKEVSQILNEMAADERARLFKDLPERVIKKFFGLMKKEEVDDVKKLMSFKEGTAGSLMTTDFVELKKEMSARRAILKIQEHQRAGQIRNIYSAYVTDDEHKLLGGIGLQMLLSAPPDMLIRDIMGSVELIKVNVDLDDEEVAKLFTKYDLSDLPVINGDNRLVGIITVDDIVDLIHKEATKDIYEIGKMSVRKGEEISYAASNVVSLVKRRAGWLIFLLIFDFLTGTVLKTFEHALGSVVALAFFIPMLLDTGGNAGAQTSITIIRGFATGDVTFKNIWRVVKMEFFAALFMGFIVGFVALLRAFFLQHDLLLALVVGLTMGLIVLLAIATGIFLPVISKRVGLDPAVLAGPITTSIVDVIGLIIYFKVAQFILPMLKGHI
ncbi:MAG: magnesium transporter [Candidatus Omnitrophica bacterium]|nr:magnesium transporter [Candidatus Omnitrophota bacterium]